MKLAVKIFPVLVCAFMSVAQANQVTCDIVSRDGKPASGTVTVDSDRFTLIEDRGEDLFYWITDLSISPMALEIQYNRATECRISDQPTSGSRRAFICENQKTKSEINLRYLGSSGRFWGSVQTPARTFELVFTRCK